LTGGYNMWCQGEDQAQLWHFSASFTGSNLGT
jgi:hypothetical protein